MSLVVRTSSSCAPERRYILQVLLGDHLGLALSHDAHDVPTTRLEYGNRVIEIHDDLLLRRGSSLLQPSALPKDPARRRTVNPEYRDLIGYASMPALYGNNDGPLVSDTEDGVVVRYDIFGTAFFLLTRLEELMPFEADAHGRFPAAASVAYQGKFLHRPVVDELVTLLAHLLEHVLGLVPPHRPTATLRLTHDMDRLRATANRTLRTVLGDIRGDLQRRRRPELAAARISSWARTRGGESEADLYHTHGILMDAADAIGHKATFFFIASTDDPHDAEYQVADKDVRDTLRAIQSRGHKLGLHGGYQSFANPSALFGERARLADAAVGSELSEGRQHYLRWRNPVTWRSAEQAGLRVDTTLGYPETPGFRCGTAHEYRAYDMEARRPLQIFEAPLVLMDQTVLGYQQGSWDDFEEEAHTWSQRSWRHGGAFTMLVHNNTLDTGRRRRRYMGLVRALGASLEAAQEMARRRTPS